MENNYSIDTPLKTSKQIENQTIRLITGTSIYIALDSKYYHRTTTLYVGTPDRDFTSHVYRYVADAPLRPFDSWRGALSLPTRHQCIHSRSCKTHEPSSRSRGRCGLRSRLFFIEKKKTRDAAGRLAICTDSPTPPRARRGWRARFGDRTPRFAGKLGYYFF